MIEITFFSELVCSTESGPTPGLPCIFPFKLDGVAYHTCKLDEKDGSRWCSTKIDKNGQHLPGNWGNCGSDCGEQSIHCSIDVLWGQPIKLIQVFSTSEFHEY